MQKLHLKDKINISIAQFKFLNKVFVLSLFLFFFYVWVNFFLLIYYKYNLMIIMNTEELITYFEDQELEVEVVVGLENWILLYIPLVSVTIP